MAATESKPHLPSFPKQSSGGKKHLLVVLIPQMAVFYDVLSLGERESSSSCGVLPAEDIPALEIYDLLSANSPLAPPEDLGVQRIARALYPTLHGLQPSLPGQGVFSTGV